MNIKYLRFLFGVVMLLSTLFTICVHAQSVPGGVNANYRVWLTPNSYSNGTWVNNITGTSSAGNFVESSVPSHAAPGKINGFNFHSAVYFSKESNTNAFNRLISTNTMALNRGENVTAIIVYEREDDVDSDYLFSFNDSNTDCDLVFYTNESNDLRLYWPDTSRGTVANTQGKGIVAVNIANNASSATALGYVDGNSQSTTGGYLASSGINSRWTIGAGNSSAASGYGFEGNIQEIIILNASGGTNNHINVADLRKIQTYLSIKYGIHLNNTDNYELYDADGVSLLTLWNRDSAFDKNIFGIGRDDASLLNQVQSSSVSNAEITVFVGDLAELNDENPGYASNILNNKQFLVFGSDGVGESAINITAGTVYADGTFIDPLIAPNDLNVVGSKYKAQLTNATTMTVNFSAKGYTYCLVSTTEDFDPSTTKAYPIDTDGKFHNVEINTTYKYVRFAGTKVGPGGVPIGLKMWLRADDPSSLTLVPGMSLSDYNKSTSIAWDGLSDPSAMQTGVTQWKDTDPARTTTYSKNDSHTSIRTPVYIPIHYLMNYHPAIDFYSNWSNLSAFLSTTAGPMSTGRPVNSTTFLVMNSALRPSNGDNSYLMSFHMPEVLTNYTQYLPALGIQSRNGDGRPRLRVNAAVDIESKLFNPGSTTISSYQFSNVSSSIPANNIVVGFNMQYGAYTSNRSVGSWYMNGNGSLGGSRYHTRSLKGLVSEVVMYEKTLSPEEKKMINSYYALKYGLTLRPNSSDYTSARFDYELSDGTSLWQGLSSEPNSPYRYYNNIAAILRDDVALLNNTQSHSTEVGSILHVGVAGESLSFDGNSKTGTFENDREAVIWGDNHGKGVTTVSDRPVCGDFGYIFNRRWYLHKVTENDRPISILVGLQNNSTNNLGQEPSNDLASSELYSAITKGNDFVMIIADDSTALIPTHANYGNFKAVIPMTWLNDEHQCAYNLSNNGTYVTFGYKPNKNGCAADEDAQFTGSKTFSWTQWTKQTNTSTAAGLTLTVNTPVNLGDNIQVTQTKVAYPAMVKANRGYPRSVNTPVKGSLRVQRKGGGFNQDVVVTITFNHPVIPEFSISDLDASSRSMEEVEIYGECSGTAYVPTLSYAGKANQAKYRISGNKATVIKTGGVSASNKNGMINVAFKGGVTSVTIKYRTKGSKLTSSTQEIYISPITLRPVPPPPTINENGLFFSKQVKEREITTCDPVGYSFYIGNVNCDPITVNFSDILPEKMIWEADSFGLDALSAEYNPSFNPQISAATSGLGEKLQVDELVIPGQATLILTGTALLEENAPSGTYSNQANLAYTITEENIPIPKSLSSEDRETKNPYTTFEATWQQRQQEVKMVPVYSRRTYSANSQIEVVYTLTNSNANITDMFMDVAFNEEFSLIGDVSVTQVSGSTVAPSPVLVTPDADTPNTFTIAGDVDGNSGFVLPTGVMEIKFRLKAPVLSDVVDEVDDDGVPTGKKVDLEIDYDFTSEMDDPCMQTAIRGLQGIKLIPYSGITHITTNRNSTAKISQ